MDSDILTHLSHHPNCFGIKLTCGGVGKGQRISAYTQSPSYLERTNNKQFFVLPGFSDILLPSMMARMRGSITGTGNVIPKTIVHLYGLIVKAKQGEKGALDEAIRVQDIGKSCPITLFGREFDGFGQWLARIGPSLRLVLEVPSGPWTNMLRRVLEVFPVIHFPKRTMRSRRCLLLK